MTQSTLTVFHLDDDDFDLELVRQKLEESKQEPLYKVRSFKNVDKFLQDYKIETTKPDIVLIDYLLNSDSWNGIKVGKEINKTNKDQIIILLSHVNEEELAKESRSAKFNNYITKKSINKNDFTQILKDTYLISKYGQLSRITSPTLLLSLQNSIGETMSFHLKRIQSIAASGSKSILITGEKGTGKSFYLNAFSKYLSEQEKLVLTIDCSIASNSQIQSIFLSYKNKTPDYLILLNLDLLPTITIKPLKRLLAIFQNNETKIIVSAISKLSLFRDFQSLSEIEVIFPALRDRPNEITSYINYFLKSIAKDPIQLDSAAELVLSRQSYKEGNISELKSILNQMSIFRTGNTLTVASLPDKLLFNHSYNSDNSCSTQCLKVNFNKQILSLNYYGDLILISLIRKMLLFDDSIRSKPTLSLIACKLEISRQTLAKKIERLISKNLIKKSEVKNWYES